MTMTRDRLRGFSENAMRICFGCVAGLTIILLIGIFALLFKNGYEAVSDIGILSFLGTDWNPVSYVSPSWGMSALFLGTAIVAGSALLFALPLALLTAIS